MAPIEEKDHQNAYKPHEQRIHEAVFDTLSKPILKKEKEARKGHSTEGKFGREEHRTQQQQQQHHLSSSLSSLTHQQWPKGERVHITLDHFGQKAKFHFGAEERDMFKALQSRVRAELPEFRGNLALKDDEGREILINNDRQLREAMARNNNRLHVFTTLSNSPNGQMAASDMGSLHGGRESRLSRSATSSHHLSSPLLRDEDNQHHGAVVEDATFLESARKDLVAPQHSNSNNGQNATFAPLAYPFWPAGTMPLMFRASWIGPNKWVYGGGGWGWGGWGPIPSRKYWRCVVGGGRPPW